MTDIFNLTWYCWPVIPNTCDRGYEAVIVAVILHSAAEYRQVTGKAKFFIPLQKVAGVFQLSPSNPDEPNSHTIKMAPTP